MIDGKFDHGYFVTVNVGSEKLKGILYHVPEQTAEQDPLSSICADDGNLASPHNHQHQLKLSMLDQNSAKQNNGGYNCFFAEQQPMLSPLHPGQDTEISRMISVRWNGLSEAEKAVRFGNYPLKSPYFYRRVLTPSAYETLCTCYLVNCRYTRREV